MRHRFLIFLTFFLSLNIHAKDVCEFEAVLDRASVAPGRLERVGDSLWNLIQSMWKVRNASCQGSDCAGVAKTAQLPVPDHMTPLGTDGVVLDRWNKRVEDLIANGKVPGVAGIVYYGSRTNFSTEQGGTGGYSPTKDSDLDMYLLFKPGVTENEMVRSVATLRVEAERADFQKLQLSVATPEFVPARKLVEENEAFNGISRKEEQEMREELAARATAENWNADRMREEFRLLKERRFGKSTDKVTMHINHGAVVLLYDPSLKGSFENRGYFNVVTAPTAP